MAQLIQHKRGRLERLSIITGSLQKGEILIVTGSSNITSSNGSSILFAATESGSVQATNRFIIGSSAPNQFPASTYGGLVNGVPYYDSGSGTLYLLGGDGNTAINLTGNISTFSASVATSFSASNASITNINTGSLVTTSSFNSYTASISTASLVNRLNVIESETGSYLTSLSGAISSSSQLTSSFDTRYVASGSISAVPTGTISSSAQITTLGFISSSSVPAGTISSSAQISTLGFVSSSTSIPAGTISGSAQIIENLPTGVVSGSSQLTSSYDTRYTLSGSVQPLPSNVVSGSSQISYTGLSNIPAGIISSSQQLPQGLVSGSSQILDGSGVISGSSQLPAGIVSGSSQILGGTGIVSGSSQITISSTTGFTDFSSSINNALTESRVTHIVTAGGGLYYIDGISNPSMSFVPGVTYRFNTTAVTGAHPFKFSTSLNGPTEYTTGVTSGTNFIQIEVGYNTTTPLYYYCTIHSNMGNAINVLKETTFENITGKPAGIVSGSSQISTLGFVSSSVTASSLVTASVAVNVITFTKGDGSTFDLSVVSSGSVTPGTISGSAQITALGFVSSSQTIDSGSLVTTSSFNSYTASIAANTGIFLQTGSAYATTNNIEITGSLKVSGTIDPDNVTVGTPSSNAWQSNLNGSYFNNFNSETNVSEILRFVAGLLSSSAPDASPNTKTYSTVTDAATNTTTGTALLGRIPQTSTNTTITYLNGKGFATAGSTIFSGITPIYTQDTYQVSYTSTAAGTTVVSSSADAQLFGLGLLSNGTPTTFKVSGSFTHRFKDNSTKTDTETSSSQVVLTQTGAGTTAGVTLAKINTANSAVIPAAYQDGKFVSVLPQKIYVTGSTSTINISGYYDVTASISIASGSSAFTTPIVVTEGIFYAPLTQIATNIPVQTSATGSTTLSYLTAVSRSLSGAPYLSGSTYSISSSITNLFNPLFYNGTVGSIVLSGTGLTATSGVTSVITSGGTISTANGVWDSANTTVRTTSTIPFETDVIRLNGLYTFGSSNITNITQTSFTPTTWTATMNGQTYTNGTAVTKANTFNYHTAGEFGQPVSSGSLAYFTRTQGADTSTALIESFTGENYRIQLADNVLAFNGTAASTVFGLYTYTSGNDLQVKPGFLVKPGGTYGYWLGDPDATKTYKYYIRKFTTSGTKTSMTLNLGKTLVNWGATTNDSVAVGILFESSKNTIYTPARIYDPSNLTDNFTATKTANSDGQNPFGANFDLYGNTGGSLSTTTYTLPLRNGDGMTLNATYTNIYVIVRYKGDPAPVTSITTTFS
jgi:hypothetical protein